MITLATEYRDRKARIATNLLRAMALVAISLGLLACANSGIKSHEPHTAAVAKQSIDEPKQRTRAMDIFIYQSRVGDAVMDKYPFLDETSGDPHLLAAEARMMAACSHLAQAALHKVSGGEPGVRLKFMVFLTLDTCESAARQVESVLGADTRLADGSF